jgi:hypothetical protein
MSTSGFLSPEREVRRGEQVCMVVIMVAGMVKTLILCAKFLVSECMASLCEVRLVCLTWWARLERVRVGTFDQSQKCVTYAMSWRVLVAW